MTEITHSETKAFIEACRAQFGVKIIGLFEGDNYARIPDLALTHPYHFILILEQVAKAELDQIRVILSDFPTFYVHLLSKIDLEQYPQHALWQFAIRRPLIGDWSLNLAQLSDEILLTSIKHSLIQVSHTARKYFLSHSDVWSSIWAVRSGRWMLSTLDHGVCRMWHYLQTGSYPEKLAGIQKPGTFLPEYDLNKLYYLIDNWTVVANKLIRNQEQLDDFLTWVSGIVERCVQEIARHSKRLMIDNLALEELGPSTTGISLVDEFTCRCRETFGENLQLLLLSGSQARGDADRLSDVDTISIFGFLDANILRQLRNILTEFPKYSSYVLSFHGLSAYPAYRYYTFHFGCKRLAGSLKIAKTIADTELLEAMRQSLLTAVQMSREYYVRGSFSVRTAASLRWQVKLIDFGYLRLLSLYEGADYLESRELVHESIQGDPLASGLLDNLRDSKSSFDGWRNDLFSGRRGELEKNLLGVNEFVQRELGRLQH